MRISTDGVTRIVILIGKYAFKIPRLNYGWYFFIQGICNNIGEHRRWLAIKTLDRKTSELFCPTLFSLAGFLNIMPRVEICTTKEQIEKFPVECRDDHKIDNYGIYLGKLVCIDYP